MSGHLGFILNVAHVAEPGSGRAVVQLYGKLRDGRPFMVRDRRPQPYFYIESSAREQALSLGAAEPEAVERRTLQGQPVLRVRLPRPTEAAALRARLHRAGVRTFEADVRFAYRYLIDRGIRSALLIDGEPRPLPAWDGAPGTVVFDEPALRPAQWKPALTTLSLDIETGPDERLLSVALWGCGAQEVLLWCPDARARAACPAAATPCAGEAELLAALGQRIRALDPDVVTGWNIIDFDVPVLIRRAEAAGAALEWGRAPGALRQRERGGGRRFSDSIFIPGRVVLDGIRLLRAVSMRLERYSLQAAAQEILGEGKTLGGGGPGHADRIMRTFTDDPPRFVEYNLTDARLALDILEKLELVPFTVERSLLTGMPPDRVGSSIAAFDFLYLSRLREQRVVAPTVGAELDAAAAQAHTQGGHVLRSRPGLHDQVLLFDFKSLYPSIIRTFQIDPLGLIRDAGAAAGAPGEDAIEAPNGARFRRRRGILSALLDDLFASREQARQAGNAVASHAIKILMNSFYGVLGTSACRFHDPRLANAITGFGKHFLLWAQTWMERRGLQVLYGDTDSLFVAGAAPCDGSRLAAALNADLAAYVAAAWRLPSYLEMEFEMAFERLFLPLLRGGRRGATKRYAGLAQGKLHFTGMEVVRRDWTALAHEVQRELYRRLFAGEPVEAYLRSVIDAVAAGRRDADLVYHKTLRKDARAYRALPPHVVAARKRRAADPPAAGHAAGSAQREVIDYVMTIEGPEPADRRTQPLDYEHYIERQLRPVAEPVLAALRRDFGEVRRNERQLELFTA